MTGRGLQNSGTLDARSNPELVGQDDAEEILLRAWKSGRLPHAWLLTGPRGVGKATLAYRFARFLLAGGAGGEQAGLFANDSPRESLELDPEHPVFRQVAAGSHGDLRVLERQADKKGRLRGSIVVDDVRAATDFLHRTASEGGWRVVVVDAAEDMNPQATNALLKELEEPSEQALILLVSHAPGRLLPTVHSRCCHLALSPLREAELERLIGRHIPEATPGEAQALTRLCEGSIGKAMSLRQAGGLSLLQDLTVIFSSFPHFDILKTQGFIDSVAGAKDGAAFETLRELLSWWMARMLRGGASRQYPPPVLEGESALMQRLYDRGGLEGWMAFWDKWDRQLARADNTLANRRQMMLGLFTDMSRLVA